MTKDDDDDFTAAIEALDGAMPDASDAEIGKLFIEKFPEVYAKHREEFFRQGLELLVEGHKPVEDREASEWLNSRMRAMWTVLENMGVAFIGPGEEILILRKPTMEEFRRAAAAGGVPEPRSWPLFYEVTFGPS
jgi:hypothetical protein